jgi:hypothetical protein
LIEVVRFDQDLPRLAPGTRGDDAISLHHVDEASGSAEADAKATLKI